LEEIETNTPDLYADLNLNSLLQDVPEMEMEIPEGLTDPDEVPEAVEEPFVQEGDLITLGAHRLLCGNSIKAEDVKRLMNGQSPTLCLTDPPYCVNYENIKRRADEPTRKERGDAYDLIPCDIMVMTFPIGKHFHVLSDATREWDILYDCVWVKNNFAFNMRRRYQQKHEMILIMRRKKHEHIGNWNVPNNQSTVFEFDKPAANVDHPTIKPIGLYLLLTKYHSNPGDLIYEPFCGSGTTMISAEQLGRTCYALELQPAYVQVAVQRWIWQSDSVEESSRRAMMENGKKKRPTYDWGEIEMEYVTDPSQTYETLSKKYGPRLQAISKHAQAGRWREKRLAFRERSQQKVREELATRAAKETADEIEKMNKAHYDSQAGLKYQHSQNSPGEPENSQGII
jgi:DNA modification methylase